MFDMISRVCRWARDAASGLQSVEGQLVERQSSRDIGKPRGRRPAALIASVLGLALTAGMASGAAAQTVAPTGSSSLSTSTADIGTPFTLTMNLTNQDASSALTVMGNAVVANQFYNLPAGVSLVSATPLSNPCGASVFRPGGSLTSFQVFSFGQASGTTCTVTFSLVATTAGVKTFSAFGVLANNSTNVPSGTVDVGSPGTVTVADPAPTVSAVTPNYMAATGGGDVVITGQNFTGATAVTFGGTVATSFTVNSATQITATVPAAAINDNASAAVAVTTADGTGTLTGGFDYWIAIGPTATSGQGGVRQGVNQASTAISFQIANQNVNGAFQSVTTTQPLPSGVTLAATPTTTCSNGAMSGGSGSTSFTLSGAQIPAGTSCTISFSVQAATRGVYTITPASVSAALVGAGTTNGNTTTVYAFDPPTIAAAFGASSLFTGGSTTLTLTVTNPNPAGLTFFNATMWDALLPTGLTGSNPATNCPSATATYSSDDGLGLRNAFLTGGASCTATLTVTAASAGSYTFTTGDLVTNSSADATAATTGVLTVTAAPPVPSVSGVSPGYASISGGNSITITGTNFGAATAVTFGGTAATSFTIDSATQITAVAPARAAGSADVQVTNAVGTSANTSADDLIYLTPPTTSIDITPATRAVNEAATMTLTVSNPNSVGLTFNITGVALPSNFSLGGPPTNGCNGSLNTSSGINLTNGTVAANSSCTIVFNPRGTQAGSYSVSVASTYATPGGMTGLGATSNTLTVAAPAPTITGLSSAYARVAGGNSIVITGTNLTGASAVTFGGTAATTFTVNSDTQITATAPAHALGLVDVVVTTSGGATANTAADDITYVAPPTASLVFSPSSVVTMQNSTLTITLTNPNPTVALTGVAMSPVTVQDYLGLNAFPSTTCGGGLGYDDVAGLSTNGGSIAAGGSCTYTLVMRGFQPNNYTFSVGTIAVINQGNPSGPGATSNTLIVNPAAPTVTSISPTSGPQAGGNAVVITGTNFSSVSAVTFGGTNATSFTVNSTTQITATAPAGTGTVDVQVTNVTGNSATSAADQYTYVAAPTVTALSPTFGRITGGETIILTGANFAGATAVSFGATPAASFTVDSATRITAIAPVANGTVNVTVTTPGGTSATGAGNQYQYFIAQGASVALSLSASTAQPGDTVRATVTLSNANAGPLTGVSYSRNPFPSGLALAATPAATNSCGGSLTAVGGGSVVTVSGGTIPASGSCQIAFDITAASSGSYFVASGTASSGQSPGFSTGSSQPLAVGYAPTVTAISPYEGSTTGGTNVMINGTDFGSTTAVMFGATPADSWTVDSATQITAVSPAGAAGTVDITVTTALGTSATNAFDRFTYVVPPSAPVINTPANGAIINSAPVPSGTADASVMVDLLLDGSPLPSVASDAGGAWTVAGPVFVSEGDHTLQASVTTVGGTATSTVTTFTFDNTPPTSPVILSPADGSATTDTTPTYSGTAEAGVRVEILVDASLVGTTTADGAGNWSFVQPSALGTGLHGVQAEALDVAGNASGLTAANLFTVYIEPNLSIADAAGASEGATADFVVALDGPAGPGGVSFTVTTAGGTATSGTDFGSLTFNGSIPEGSDNLPFSIGTLTDGLYERDEAFSVSVTNILGAGVTDAAAVGTILDVDSPPSFAINNVTVTEGSAGLTQAIFTVSKTGDTQLPASVDYATNSVTAVANDDYLPLSGTLVFAAGETSKTVIVAVTGDTLFEADETFVVNLDSAIDATISVSQGVGTIINDDAQPAVSVNDVTQNEGNSGTTAFVFTASLSAASGAPVTVDYGTMGLTANDGPDYAGVTGTFTFAPGETIKTASVQVVGDNVLELDETFAFNLSNASGAVFADSQGIGTILNDDVAPPSAPTVVAPANGSVTQDTTPTYSGTAAIGATVEVIIDGAAVGTVTVDGMGGWNLTPAAPLGEGAHSVRATASNAGGTSPSSATNTFIVDSVAPAAPVILSPANGSTTADNTPTYSGTAEPNATILVLVDGAPYGGTTATGAGSWTFTPVTSLADGPHTVRATAMDAAGNVSVQSSGNTFTVDTAAPAAPVVIAPANGSVTNDNTPTYSGTAEPGSTVTVSIGGSPIGTTTANGAGNWSLTPATPLVDDFYSVRATATDASGNVSSNSMSNSFRVDTTAPASPVVINPANGSTTVDNTPPYSGTAEPNTTVTVIVDGSPIGATGSGITGTWSFTPFVPLADGSHTVRVTATDGAGNTSPNSNTSNFTVDTTAPAAPVVLSPANGSSSTNMVTTISGTAEPASTVTVRVDGGSITGNATADGSGNWAYTTPPLALGLHTVNATATDASGNGSATSNTNSFTVLPFPPVAGAVSATVAYGSTNNPITLNLLGGAADSVAVGTQATHGVATASGMSITYTPTAGYAGTDSFTYTATNAGGTSSPATVTVTVGSPTLSLAPASVPAPTVGQAYSQTLTTSGGVAPYSYAVTSGALPTGLTLSSGVISGTPTAGGAFSFTITATDASTGTGPFSTSQAYSGSVGAPTISVSPMSDTATVGTSFTRTFTAIGGTAPYSFAITAGALPPGMSLAPNGQLSGAPTAGGSFSFTISATDSSTGTGPYSGSRAYTLPVNGATITVPSASLPAGAVTAPYTAQLPAASGGTAPYSYAVTAGSLPAGMTLSSTGALSGTPTAAGTFNFGVTVTDSSTGSGPYSGTQAYSVTIAAPTIAVGPTSLPDGVKAIVYTAQTISASGGVAPYSYAVTAGSLPNGMALSPTGLLSGTPTENGTFNFTVTATDSTTGSGPYTGSRAYTLNIALDPPTANPVSVTVGYGSSNNPVTLNLTGGAANSIAIASLPAHGTATVSGMSITYTPSATYFGPDSFTYTATNGSGTSAPATVSVSVGFPPAPTASGTSVAVPYASSGTAIDLSSRVAGVSTGVSVASAPAHGTTSVSGYVITYTPSATYFGPDSFTYVAVGPGGNSAPATISLTVANPPPPVVTPTPPTPVPPTTGGSSTVNLQTQVGGVVTGWRITVAPTNGTAVIEGTSSAPAMPAEGPQSTGPALTLRYTPTSTFMGTDSVTLVAEGPGGDSAPVVFTFQVPGMAPNRTATLASNAVSTINATSGLTGGPFNSVQITRAPGFGTATVSGLNIVFTPGAPNAGPTYLEYTVTTPGGTSAAGRIDYTVNRAPGVQTLTATTPAGRPVTVSITANAVGGPFTGAAITSLSIPTAGTAVLAEGGVAGNRTYTVTFTPAGTFTGRVDVRFTLTNAFATEAGVIQVIVTPRADPTMDPDVRGLVSSQVDSTRRFARAQTDNFSRRLEQLRDGTNDSSSNLSLNLNMGGESEIDPRAAARRRLGDQQANAEGLGLMEVRARDEEAEAFAQFSNRNGESEVVAANAAPTGLNAVSTRQEAQGGENTGSVGVWAAGSIDWGRRDLNNQRDTRFTTSGVSAGVDVKVSDGLIIGAGLGYGEDRARIGSNDTSSDGTNVIGAVYAAMKGPADVSFEAMLGYGSLDYTSRRWSTAASAFAFGEREGDMVFGSIGVAQDHKWTGVASSIYGRLEGQSVNLDAFTETGAGIHSLTYDEMKFNAFSSTVGVRLNWQVQTRDMVFTPSLRMEWAHEFSDTGVQTVSYADWVASPRYALNMDDWARDRFQLGLEGRWTFDNMELTAGYRGSTSSNANSHGVEFKLTTKF